jgi:hypothetical protein
VIAKLDDDDSSSVGKNSGVSTIRVKLIFCFGCVRKKFMKTVLKEDLECRGNVIGLQKQQQHKNISFLFFPEIIFFLLSSIPGTSGGLGTISLVDVFNTI